MQGRIPLFFDIHQGQVNGLLSSHIIGKLHLGFDVLPDLPVHIFNGIGGIDDFSDLHRKIKIAGQVLPVSFPGQDSVFVFLLPFSCKACKGVLSGVFIGSGIYLFEIGTEGLPVLPDHVLAAIADLVDNAQLGDGLGKDALNGVRK